MLWNMVNCPGSSGNMMLCRWDTLIFLAISLLDLSSTLSHMELSIPAVLLPSIDYCGVFAKTEPRAPFFLCSDILLDANYWISWSGRLAPQIQFFCYIPSFNRFWPELFLLQRIGQPKTFDNSVYVQFANAVIFKKHLGVPTLTPQQLLFSWLFFLCGTLHKVKRAVNFLVVVTLIRSLFLTISGATLNTTQEADNVPWRDRTHPYIQTYNHHTHNMTHVGWLG